MRGEGREAKSAGKPRKHRLSLRIPRRRRARTGPGRGGWGWGRGSGGDGAGPTQGPRPAPAGPYLGLFLGHGCARRREAAAGKQAAPERASHALGPPLSRRNCSRGRALPPKSLCAGWLP